MDAAKLVVRKVLLKLVAADALSEDALHDFKLREYDIIDNMCENLSREGILSEDSEVLLEVAETKKKDDGRRLAERSLNDLTVFTKPNREEFVHNIFSQELNFENSHEHIHHVQDNAALDNEQLERNIAIAKNHILVSSECLIIVMNNPLRHGQIKANPRSSDNDYEGLDKEIFDQLKLLDKVRAKHPISLVDFKVKGSGKLCPVWIDDEDYPHSRDFYLTIIEDFLKQCHTPGALIWFVGSGEEETGNWCFRDGVIAFEDIFCLYENLFKCKLLHIITDCSYSGSWVIRLAEILEAKGIPPCGHCASNEEGLALKIWASSTSTTTAKCGNFLRTSLTVGDPYPWLCFDLKGTQPGHERRYINTAFHYCPSNLSDNTCSLDKNLVAKFKWRDLTVNLASLVYLVRGKDRGKAAWHYVLVDEEKLNVFKEKMKSGNIDVADYGRIVQSGWGTDPPEDVSKQIKSFFA